MLEMSKIGVIDDDDEMKMIVPKFGRWDRGLSIFA